MFAHNRCIGLSPSRQSVRTVFLLGRLWCRKLATRGGYGKRLRAASIFALRARRKFALTCSSWSHNRRLTVNRSWTRQFLQELQRACIWLPEHRIFSSVSLYLALQWIVIRASSALRHEKWGGALIFCALPCQNDND